MYLYYLRFLCDDDTLNKTQIYQFRQIKFHLVQFLFADSNNVNNKFADDRYHQVSSDQSEVIIKLQHL